MINGFLNWSQYQYYDYYNYQDVEDFHMKAEELLEEVEIEEHVKNEDTLEEIGEDYECEECNYEADSRNELRCTSKATVCEWLQ